MTITAAGALAWLATRLRIPGRWLGLSQNRVGLAAPVSSFLLAALVLLFHSRELEFTNAGPFEVYYTTAEWLARNVSTAETVLDMTDWSLYFSERTGYHFADVYKAPADPAMRWVVVRGPHVEGRWPYTQVIRALIGDRDPVAMIPPQPARGQLQVRIYDRQAISGPFVDRTGGSSSDRASTQGPRQRRARSPRMETRIPVARSRDQGSGS